MAKWGVDSINGSAAYGYFNFNTLVNAAVREAPQAATFLQESRS